MYVNHKTLQLKIRNSELPLCTPPRFSLHSTNLQRRQSHTVGVYYTIVRKKEKNLFPKQTGRQQTGASSETLYS